MILWCWWNDIFSLMPIRCQKLRLRVHNIQFHTNKSAYRCFYVVRGIIYHSVLIACFFSRVPSGTWHVICQSTKWPPQSKHHFDKWPRSPHKSIYACVFIGACMRGAYAIYGVHVIYTLYHIPIFVVTGGLSLRWAMWDIFMLCFAQDPDMVLPSEDRTGLSVDPSTVASSWYSEVLELRRRAEEYKRRAHGTHFLRSHLGQLYAKQAELWDTASSSSVVSALSLESPHTALWASNTGRPAMLVFLRCLDSWFLDQP